MAYLLLTVQLSAEEANPAGAAHRLEVSPSDLDPDFGVVGVDTAAGLYAVRVEESVVSAAAARTGVEGPFSNPRIETLGPPEPTADRETRDT